MDNFFCRPENKFHCVEEMPSSHATFVRDISQFLPDSHKNNTPKNSQPSILRQIKRKMNDGPTGFILILALLDTGRVQKDLPRTYMS
jgi:hypothetical protein